MEHVPEMTTVLEKVSEVRSLGWGWAEVMDGEAEGLEVRIMPPGMAVMVVTAVTAVTVVMVVVAVMAVAVVADGVLRVFQAHVLFRRFQVWEADPRDMEDIGNLTLAINKSWHGRLRNEPGKPGNGR